MQGDLGDEAESLERDLADPKRSLAAEKALETKLVENCGKLLTEDEEHVQDDTVEHIVDVPVTRLLVFIMVDTDEPIPEWLNSVKGVVDSEDIPLNVCRETPRQNKILRVIKGNHVTKHSEILAEIAELLDGYKKLYEQCGKCRNHEDSTVGVETAEVLRFNTTEPGGKPISCMESRESRRKKEDNALLLIRATRKNRPLCLRAPRCLRCKRGVDWFSRRRSSEITDALLSLYSKQSSVLHVRGVNLFIRERVDMSAFPRVLCTWNCASCATCISTWYANLYRIQGRRLQ